MKANKIWFVILFILVAGTCFTRFTRNYVNTARESLKIEMAEARMDSSASEDPADGMPAMERSDAQGAVRTAESDGNFAGVGAELADGVSPDATPSDLQEKPATAAVKALPVPDEAYMQQGQPGSAGTAGMQQNTGTAGAQQNARTDEAQQSTGTAGAQQNVGTAGTQYRTGAADPAARQEAGAPNGISGTAGSTLSGTSPDGGSRSGKAFSGEPAGEASGMERASADPGMDSAAKTREAESLTPAGAGSPLQGKSSSAPKQRKVNGYINRLEELDLQLSRNHGVSADATANTLKAAAENERKLWEAELKRILDILEEVFEDEEEDELFLAQKEWIRDREDIAVEASKKQSGSAMEEVEYNLSLAQTTRARAYELAEEYATELAEAN